MSSRARRQTARPRLPRKVPYGHRNTMTFIAPLRHDGSGCRLFLLPECSPDLNPIGQIAAPLKHPLRKAAARTQDAVCNAIARSLATYTSQERTNDLKNSGYGRT